MTDSYNTENIRTLLTKGFSLDELRAFCFDNDNFREVFDNCRSIPHQGEFIAMLLEYADQRLLYSELLTWAEGKNPSRYNQHGPYEKSATVERIPDELSNILQKYYKLLYDNFHNTKVSHNVYLHQIYTPPKFKIPSESSSHLLRDEDPKTETSKPAVDIKKLLEDHECVHIRGETRFGKSTLASWLAAVFAFQLMKVGESSPYADTAPVISEKDTIPFFIDCDNLMSLEINLKQDRFTNMFAKILHAYTAFSETEIKHLEEGIRQKLDDGSAFVIMDALNAIPDSDPIIGNRRSVFGKRLIEEFARRKIRVLITYQKEAGRTTPIDKDFEFYFSPAEILPLDESDKTEIVKKWCKATGEAYENYANIAKSSLINNPYSLVEALRDPMIINSSGSGEQLIGQSINNDLEKFGGQ